MSNQADYILKTEKSEIWYSEQYLKQQMEQAYYRGICKGAKIQFHAIVPMDDEHMEELVNKFVSIAQQKMRLE